MLGLDVADLDACQDACRGIDTVVHLAADPSRLERLAREAQVLASLNHPHIAAIYGVEESAGGRALVLELVEGETLADRIARGPVPLEGRWRSRGRSPTPYAPRTSRGSCTVISSRGT